MLQHDGCDEGNNINSARNFTGSIINYLTFNNGISYYSSYEPKITLEQTPGNA